MLLLSNALIVESMDVTMRTLLARAKRGIAAQLQAVLDHVTSSLSTNTVTDTHSSPPSSSSSSSSAAPADVSFHATQTARGDATSHTRARASHHMHRTASESAAPTLFADPHASPGWVLDALSLITADVLGTAVWTRYLARGTAVGDVLADAALTSRTRHVASMVADWRAMLHRCLSMTAGLGFDVRAAAAAVTIAEAPVEEEAPSTTTKRSRTDHVHARREKGPAGRRCGSQHFYVAMDFPAERMARRNDASRPLARVGGAGESAEATEERRWLLPLLVAIAERPWQPPPAVRDAVMHMYSGSATHPSTSNVDSSNNNDSNDSSSIATANHGSSHMSSLGEADTRQHTPAPARPIFRVRDALSYYPAFAPLRGVTVLPRRDEAFLFHWFVPMVLHLLTTLQECWLTPRYVRHRELAAADVPVRRDGSVSPQEGGPLGVLCGGGGNYVVALALLQWVVHRLLVCVLCRGATWAMVYHRPDSDSDSDSDSAEEKLPWQSSEAVLRQQLFFFALYIDFWAPLYDASLYAASAGGASALCVLTWLTMRTGGKDVHGGRRRRRRRRWRRRRDGRRRSWSRCGLFSPTCAPSPGRCGR